MKPLNKLEKLFSAIEKLDADLDVLYLLEKEKSVDYYTWKRNKRKYRRRDKMRLKDATKNYLLS
jgi:hypothetical protein